MILINLLPHREAARKRKRESFYATLGLSALLGGVLAGAIFLWYATQISDQQAKNSVLVAEIKRREAQIQDIARKEFQLTAIDSAYYRERTQLLPHNRKGRNAPKQYQYSQY